jgi:pimeloyl-ACP methyl ester carboxylesterase
MPGCGACNSEKTDNRAKQTPDRNAHAANCGQVTDWPQLHASAIIRGYENIRIGGPVDTLQEQLMSALASRIHSNDYRSRDLEIPAAPWWANLPEDFHRLSDDFQLDSWDRVRVQGTAAVDALVRTGLAGAVSAVALPSLLNVRAQQREREDMEFYFRFADGGDPHAFFHEPARTRVDAVREADWYHFRPEDGDALSLTFESPFQPVNPRLREAYLSHQRNRTARAQYWCHQDGPRPTLVVVHGFVADPYWLNTRFLALPWFYKQGYDVLLYTMPFHGERQGKFSPFSGSGFFSHGISHINEAFAQTIHDLRIFLHWLRQRGTPDIGVTGISLGGYTSSLLSCIDEELGFVIPNVPVVSLMDLMMSWWPLNLTVRNAMRLNGMSLTDLRHVTAMHSALTWKSRVPAERQLIVGGAGDRFVPPKQVWLLHQHWRQCRMHWFPGNHLVHLDQGRYLREMLAFMQNG